MQSSVAHRCYRALIFAATVFTVAACLFLIDANLISQRDRFQESDYIMTFYVAGKLVAEGRAGELYPSPDALTFVGSPFDHAAHEFLPHLPKSSAGAYMYIPLVAGFFAPLSWLNPNQSLFLWHLLSLIALALCCRVYAFLSGCKASEMFFLSFLFAPVFLTLWAGQLGLPFGLLPLSIGFICAYRGRETAAGFFWSLLLLKPQYFLAGAFVALALVMARRYRTFIAMSAGVVVILLMNILAFGADLTLEWLASHRVSDAMYSSGRQVVPSHLISGLPANVLVLLPFEMRDVAKLPLYAAAALLWAGGFVYLAKLRRLGWQGIHFLTAAMIIGSLLSALTLPHLLYYDLCVLLPAGYLLFNRSGTAGPQTQRWIAASGWLVISAFLPLLLATPQQTFLPLILQLILFALTVMLLWQMRRKQIPPALMPNSA